jgi:O-antigen ligase
MPAIMNLGYETAIYLLVALIGIPILFWRPHLLVYLLIIETYFPSLAKIKFSLGHVNVYTNDLIFIFYSLSLFFILFSAFLQKRRLLDLCPTNKLFVYLVIAYIFLNIYFMASALLYGVPVDSAIRRFQAYGSCLYFFLPLLFIRDYKEYYNILVFVVVISLIYPVWQLYAFMGSSSHFITTSGTVRASGNFAVPLIALSFFAIMIWQRGMKQYVPSFILIVAIIMVGHRSAYVAFALSVILLFIWLRNVGKIMIYGYLATLCIPLILVCYSYISGYDWLGSLMTRGSDTLSTTDRNTLARAYTIKDNFLVFLAKPLLGIGYNYEQHSNILTNSAQLSKNTFLPTCILHPHNFFMRHLSHTGIVGTSLITLIIFSALKNCYSCISKDGTCRKIGILLFCSICFFLVYALMNTVFFSTGCSSLFWILAGITVVFTEKEMGSDAVKKW